MKQGIEKQVEGYIEEVGLYSKEHRDYIDKLNNVLDEMKNSGNFAERQHYNSFRETVDSFKNYMAEKKITLTVQERERFAVIAASRLGGLAKKRMAEDLMRSVRERHMSDLSGKIEEDKKKHEIEALEKSGFFLLDWFRLFKYSLDYGTITPFSHRYRSVSLDVIRVHTVAAYRSIHSELFKILDEDYYLLSVVEYNSIVKLAETGIAAERFCEVKRNGSYDPAELYDLMEDLASKYICVVVNAPVIEKSLRKVFREKQPGHGFWGFAGILMDRPIKNNLVVRLKGVSMIRNTICGALCSFYTSHFGVAVTTFGQVMHLVNEDGRIDGESKKLTQGAVSRIKEEDDKRQSDDFRVKIRLDEIAPLTMIYREKGQAMAAKLLALNKKTSHTSAKELPNRPLAGFIQVLEGYARYILDPVAGNGGFGLEYDGEVTDVFFTRCPELVKAAEDFLMFSQELQGSRGRDVAAMRIPPSHETVQIVQMLADPERELPAIENARLLRETLSAISSRCYNLCMRFNDVIVRFNTTGKNEPPEKMDKYDFAVNSKLKHSKVRGLESVLSKKDISLMDLLEAGCSMGLYVADYLGHSGIRAVQSEVEKLRKELRQDEAGDSGTSRVAPAEEKGGIAGEMERVYYDNLTGFRKWGYFEDFILPVYYDSKNFYNGDVQRYVFCCEISNLAEINRKFGNDTGDIVYRRFGGIINAILAEKGAENIALRDGGGIVTGYITGIPQTTVVDIMYRILKEVRNIPATEEKVANVEVLFNAGIYREWKGSDAYRNIDVARKIMFQMEDGIASHVGFLRNQDYVVTDKDFDRRGYMREGMISVLM